MARRGVPALLALALVTAGCGDGGVSTGATVPVYVAAPLCAAAKRTLAQEGPRAGDVVVRVACLSDPSRGRHLDLAMVGANARRATEDSSSVAYVEGPGRTLDEFSRPIVDSADLAWVRAASGSRAMRRVLHAVAASSPSSLRADVRTSLDGS